MLESYWRRENPKIPELPWGPADAGALAQFLRANPSLSPDLAGTSLENRLRSEDHAPAERVYRWIGDLLRYASGPLNRFKQPMRAVPGASEASVGTYRDGTSYSPEDETGPIRNWTSKEWQEEARRKRSSGEELSTLELQFIWEEEARAEDETL
jgi:hypothetical protein